MQTDTAGKIRVLHFTHGLGGIKTYLEFIFKYGDTDNFEFSVAAPRDPGFELFCTGLAKYYPLKVNREVNVFSDFFLLIKLVRLIRKVRPDILHVHSGKGGFLGRVAAKLSGVKVIYTPHGFSYLSFTGVKRIIYFSLERLVRGASDLLVAVSPSEANRAVYELGYQPEKVRVILNSVIPSPALTRDYGRIKSVGMIGRLTIQKNPMLFLEIARSLLTKYPALEFRILGAGLTDHLGGSLSEFIKEQGLSAKIKLLQWGSQAESENFITETDIYVMTSVFEGLSFALLEAMNTGCPCVVSKCDGNNDVIQNNVNGFSCLTKNEFIFSMSKLIESQSLRTALGTSATVYIRNHHNVLNAVKQLEQVYKSLIRV